MRFFELADKLDAKFSPLVARGTNIRTPGGCGECSTLPKDCGPPDVVRVKNTSPAGVVLFTSWGFGVIAVELLEFLGNDAAQCLRLGRLANPNGDIIEEFRTFVGVERIILRGNRESEHRICKSCGALIYTYLPPESPYVTAPQIASGRPIYEITMQLLVNESIRERIGDRWSDVLTFYDVPVLTSPRDGLPIDIGLWPNKDQVMGYQPNLPKWMKRQS